MKPTPKYLTKSAPEELPGSDRVPEQSEQPINQLRKGIETAQTNAFGCQKAGLISDSVNELDNAELDTNAYTSKLREHKEGTSLN